MPQNDWRDHLEWVQRHALSIQQSQDCDPTVKWAIDMQQSMPHLSDPQSHVLQDIEDLRDAMSDETQLLTLPLHDQRAYKQPKMITQVPLMTHLLRMVEYPQTQSLHDEMSNGFDLLGPLRPAHMPGPQISVPLQPERTTLFQQCSNNIKLMTIGHSWPQRLREKTDGRTVCRTSTLANQDGLLAHLPTHRHAPYARPSSAHANTPTLNTSYTCGTMALTVNHNQRWHTCSFSRQTVPPSGTTTCCSLDLQPARGATTSATP